MWRLSWDLKRGRSAVLCLFPASFSFTSAGEDRERLTEPELQFLSEWAQGTEDAEHERRDFEWSQNCVKTDGREDVKSQMQFIN